MRMFKNPRLNSYVYTLTYAGGKPWSICKCKVYMKNKQSFITEDALNESVSDEYKVEYYFEDYQKTWFSNIKSIRNTLKERHHEKYVILKCSDDFWSVEER